MTEAPTLFHRYKNKGEKFVDYVVTDGGTWINYSNAEAKKRFIVQCILVRENNANLKKYFVAVSYRVLCLEQKIVLQVALFKPEAGVTSEVFSETLKS
jgi:hypothetical protein